MTGNGELAATGIQRSSCLTQSIVESKVKPSVQQRNAWPKLGHATQRAEQQQLCNTVAEKSKNQGVAVTKKSRPLTERAVGHK